MAQPYHHGNLKEALLEAAVALIAEAGPKGFTLREVARRAGVSHNAPYRHFRDKDELLMAVAAQGFERLNQAMQTRAGEGATPLERWRLCGTGYVDFALQWPQHFTAMFDVPQSDKKPPEYEGAGEAAFQTLLGCIVDCQNAGQLPPGDPLPAALLAWSLVHGIAKLAISGLLPFDSAGVLNFTDAAARIMARGMRDAETSDTIRA